MITLTGRFELPDGSPDHGEVWVQAVVTATDVTPRSALVTQAPVVLRLDSAGEVSTELRASDDDGWQTTAPVRYRVSYRLSQRRWWAEYLILAEMGPVVELQRLTPVEEGTEVLPIPVPGLSAYELAVAQGYQGTESEWLASLQGKDAVAPTVQVVETVTGAPGSAASVTDLDSGPDARWRVTIPEGKPSTVPGPPNVLSVGTVTTGAPGSAAAASITGTPPAQVLSLTLPQGIQGRDGDLTQRMADLRYERRSGLLSEAVWHVDAGELTDAGGGLADLTGNGRDAVFGAGATAPVVLPYDGEPYVYYPQQTGNGIAELAGGGTPTSTVTAVLRRKWEWATDYGQQFFQVGSGVRYLLTVSAGGTVLISNWVGAPTVSIGNKPVPTKEWIRITLNCETGEALCEQSDDGTLWVTLFTASHGKPPAFDSSIIYIGGGSAAHSAPGRLYSARINFDGQDVAILDPRNVNADYTRIRNTGTAGGDWTITRAATGFKTAVVDRPLVLFGGGQTLNRPPALPYSTAQTLLAAFRRFGTTGTEVVIDTRSVPAVLDGMALITTNGVPSYRVVGKSIGWSPSGKNVISGNSSMAVVGSASDCRAYENGVLVATTASMDWDGGDSDGPQIGSRDGSFGANMEFIAAAIFDRALTDAEVAQASAELLDTPHYAQADPHPQYLRQRLTRPNLDDRLVETWDGSKWVATYYDTGLRDVRSLLVNGWTASIATLLRIGRKVTMVVYLDPTAATSDIFFVPPVGFEPVHLGVSAPGVGSATSVNLIEVSGQQLRSVFHTATQVYYCRIDWETAPTVPTSLPGTLISAAP